MRGTINIYDIYGIKLNVYRDAVYLDIGKQFYRKVGPRRRAMYCMWVAGLQDPQPEMELLSVIFSRGFWA